MEECEGDSFESNTEFCHFFTFYIILKLILGHMEIAK